MALLKQTLLSIGLLLGTSLVASHVYAEQYKKEFGPYVTHYNAFNSSTLSPELAKTYRISRGSNMGVIVLSIHRKNDENTPDAVTAMVKGEVRNELSQLNHLEFRELIEGDAIYYVAAFRLYHNEMMGFKVRVQPEGNSDTLDLAFSQRFYKH